MKRILIPLNFTTQPTRYDTQQSFSTADVGSAVLEFTTTETVTGTVANLLLKNTSQNATIAPVVVERLDVSTAPFSYTLGAELQQPGEWYGEMALKKDGLTLASATFTFGIASSLAVSVLPKLIRAYSLDDLVERTDAEINALKDAYHLEVTETVAHVNKTESTLQANENTRYLNEKLRKANENTRKANELERVEQENARGEAEADRVTAFNTLVDSAVIEQVVLQEVGEKYQEIEATQANRLLSVESELADTLNKSAITLTHMFADAAARDAYFVSHPTELVELQFIKVGTGYQQYIEGAWQSSTAIVSEQLSATNQPIVDTGEYFVAENTNDALQELGAHKLSTENPHGVTKTQVGLGNVDNTSDVNKPVSTAMQTALDLKANKAQEAWITPTLLGKWVNQGDTYSQCGFRKDEFGMVHLKGMIKNTVTAQTQICILPIGYRPIEDDYFIIASFAGPVKLSIKTHGMMYVEGFSGGWISLRGVYF